MQKRPYLEEYAPIRLPDDFPLVCDARRYRQEDAPITRLHLHDCLEIGYCHAGSGIFVVEDKVLSFAAGDVSVINDRELHLAQSTAGTHSEWSWCHVDPRRLLAGREGDAGLADAGPLGGPGFPNIISGTEHPGIAVLVRELVAEMGEHGAGHRAAARGLVVTLMARLHRLASPVPAGDARGRRADLDRLAPALQLVAERYGEALAVEDLAAAAALSPTHLRRLFRRALGRTPRAWLNHFRVQMAQALLADTDRPVLAISLAVGFETLSTFNRNFLAVTGMAPRQWRQLR